jgi:hypothetical protein
MAFELYSGSVDLQDGQKIVLDATSLQRSSGIRYIDLKPPLLRDSRILLPLTGFTDDIKLKFELHNDDINTCFKIVNGTATAVESKLLEDKYNFIHDVLMIANATDEYILIDKLNKSQYHGVAFVNTTRISDKTNVIELSIDFKIRFRLNI